MHNSPRKDGYGKFVTFSFVLWDINSTSEILGNVLWLAKRWEFPISLSSYKSERFLGLRCGNPQKYVCKKGDFGGKRQKRNFPGEEFFPGRYKSSAGKEGPLWWPSFR